MNCLLILCISFYPLCVAFQLEVFTAGQQALSKLLSKSTSDPCWKSSVESLQQQCSYMTADDRRLLSLKLLNCHLTSSGREPLDCEIEKSLDSPNAIAASCTKKLSDINFQLYTSFFIDSQHICYFLNQEILQEKALIHSFQLNEKLENMRNRTNELGMTIDKVFELQQTLTESYQRMSTSSFYGTAVALYFATIPNSLRAARVPCLTLLTAAALFESSAVEQLDAWKMMLARFGFDVRGIDTKVVYRATALSVGAVILGGTWYLSTLSPVMAATSAAVDSISSSTPFNEKMLQQLAKLDHVLPHHYASLFLEKK